MGIPTKGFPLAKDQFPRTFEAHQGIIKLESDDRLAQGTYLTTPARGALMSKINVFEFIQELANKAGLTVQTAPNGALTVLRPENLLVQKRREELANTYGARPFAELDHVSKALIKHIVEMEVADGKHRDRTK
jgi:hypothetical protein